MDLREKKTRRSISNAFLQLRREKPLERITVKELAQLAEISKATFYLHYRDIFDLSDSLQEQTIRSILSGITHPEYYLENKTAFLLELLHGFYAHQNLIDILFSGSQSAALPMRVEKELRDFVHKLLPHADPRTDMLLTYQIQGSFFVYQEYHHQYSMDDIICFLGDISNASADIFSANL